MRNRAFSALQQYQRVSVQSGVESASPHRLIQMLMEGALAKMAAAEGHMQRGEIEQKGRQIGWAISIIGGLRASLDHEQGGEVAANLDVLYEYMERRLFDANLQNDASILAEVHRLMTTVKDGWDGIAAHGGTGREATGGLAAGANPA